MTKVLSRSERGALAESLSYWFLRLNGFFTIENFILHRDLEDTDPGMRTDADIVGVRFPYRDEQGMQDHPLFAQFGDLPLVVIAEATAGMCKINGPWSKPERGNVERLLLSLGFVPKDKIRDVAARFYRKSVARTPRYRLMYVSLGLQRDERLAQKLPLLIQVTWAEALGFIHDRFNEYRLQKADHQRWRQDGLELWDNASRGKNRFVSEYVKWLGGRPEYGECSQTSL